MAIITATPIVGTPTFSMGGHLQRRVKYQAVVTSKSVTPYSSGDALGDLIKIPLGQERVNFGVVHTVSLFTNKATGTTAVILYGFDGLIAEIADNAAFTLPYSDAKKRIISNQFTLANTAMTASGGGISAGIDLDFVLTPGTNNDAGNDLYVQPVIAGAYTPDNGQLWQFEFIICCW